jgi:Tol biopolymer transport system component
VQDRIVAVDIETGRSRDVMTLPFAEASLPRGAQHFALAVSPEGNQLAMMTYDRESELTRVAVVGTDGRDYQEVVPPLKAVNIRNKLAWTPDGRWLIAVSGGQDDESYRIIRVPIAGGAVEESGLEIERLNAMSISPDGSRLAYSTLNPEGWGELLWSLDVAAILRSDR